MDRCSWAFITTLSIGLALRLHCWSLFGVLLLHEFGHYLQSSFRRFRVWVLGKPFRAVGIPFLIDNYLPFRLIGQCVICLPWLKHFRLGFDLQDSMTSCGRSTPSIVVEPTTDTLRHVKSAHEAGIGKHQYLLIFIAYIPRCQFNRTCLINFFLRCCGHRPFFAKCLDDVGEKFFRGGPPLIRLDKPSFVRFEPAVLFVVSPSSAGHPE